MKNFCVTALVVGTLSLASASAQADRGSVTPGISVTTVPNGTIVTPSVSGSLRVGGGTLQGTITAPVAVPNGGAPQTLPPSAQIQFTIPLK